MIQILTKAKPDSVGALSGGLCVLHCLATPFVFFAKAHSTICCGEKPLWWQSIDYVFLVISFFAVYYASKNSTKNLIKLALWGVWIILSCAIINETFEIVHLPEASVYIPALVLVGLHLYNQKYCKCAGDNCCVD